MCNALQYERIAQAVDDFAIMHMLLYADSLAFSSPESAILLVQKDRGL